MTTEPHWQSANWHHWVQHSD